MTMLKKVISLTLTLVTVLSLLVFAVPPTGVSAASTSINIREVKNITIFNKATGQCFCHEYEKVGNGVRVWSWQYDGEGNNFNIEKVKDGVYRLVTTVDSSYAIDVNCPGKIRNKNLLKKNLQIDLWKKGGPESFAQNLIIEPCGDGYYYLRMAENKNLCLASSGKNKRIVLATFNGSNSQKWTFKDATGKKTVDITSQTTNNTVTANVALKKTAVTYTIDNNAYTYATTTKAYGKHTAGSAVWVDANGSIVTDSVKLNALQNMYILNQTRENMLGALESWKDSGELYYDLFTEWTRICSAGNVLGTSLGMATEAAITGGIGLADLSLEIVGTMAEPSNVATSATLALCRVYSTNVVACADAAIRILNKPVLSYESAQTAVEMYALTAGNHAALNSLIGEDIETLANSKWYNMTGEYLWSTLQGFANAITPGMAAQIASYATNGTVSLVEFGLQSGATAALEAAYSKNKVFLSNKYPSLAAAANEIVQAAQFRFVMPLNSKYSTNIETQAFGNYYSKMGGRHLGSDLGTRGNRATNVNAIADGTVYRVLKTANSGGYGNLVVIKHQLPTGQIFFSAYGHLKNYSVREGQKVVAGENIGVMGSTGSSSGPHVHLAVYSGSVSKATIPAGYTSKRVTGDSFKVDKITYYDPIRVIETNGTIIK